MPVFLALLLGFQHALAMLAGVITPPVSHYNTKELVLLRYQTNGFIANAKLVYPQQCL